MSFNFKAENGTDTSITEVTTDISKDNGYGATSSLYQKSWLTGGFIVKDGTNKQEGVTTTNGNYSTGTSDTLVNSKALAKYDFITTTTGTSWRIPDWCNYIKVFLIGGGGAGAQKYHTIPQDYGGTGGGCGQLAVAGIKVTGGSTYNIIIGAGGTADPLISGVGKKGGDGVDTVFQYPAAAPLVTIRAKGGKGGWGALGALDKRNGWGGGQDGGSNTNRYHDHSYDITDVNYWASFYSGKPSNILYPLAGNPAHFGTEINPGGKGFAQGVEHKYGFYPDPVGNPTNTPGLVREMGQPYAMSSGYGIASGYGHGGDGAAGFIAVPLHGAAGCACVFYFPFEID